MIAHMPILHVDYEASVGWAHPILAALESKPSLTARRARWQDIGLSDLAFAIETRFGTMHEAVRLLGEGLWTLSQELGGDPRVEERVEEHIRRGAAYHFHNRDALRRVLLGAGTFITEARACFENLADFAGDFLEHYFAEKIGDKKDRYEAIAKLSRDRAWVADLQDRRHDLVHHRAPWLGFKVLDNPRRYEPFLAFNWRPSATDAADIVAFPRLLAIRAGLDEVAYELREALIAKVREAA